MSSEGLPLFSSSLCASLCCDDLLEHNWRPLFPPHLWSLFTVIITQPLTLSHERRKLFYSLLVLFSNFFCPLPLSSAKSSIIPGQRHTQDLWDYQAVSLAGVPPSHSPRGWALKSSMVPPDKAFLEVELAFFLVGPWNQLSFNLFGIEWKAEQKSNALYSDGSDWPLDK